jgi:CheY-like chemotaxis protein
MGMALRSCLNPWIAAADEWNVPQYVLILDDDKTFGQTICAALKADGFPAVAVSSAAAALELVKKVRPALILLDLVMPGMDGEHFLGILKSELGTAAIPLIVISAKMNDARAAELTSLGADVTVAKSKTTLAEIRRLVQQYLKWPKTNAA